MSEKCKDSARRLFSMKAPHLPLSAYFYRVHPDGTVDCEGGRWIPPGMEDVLRDEWTIRQIQES